MTTHENGAWRPGDIVLSQRTGSIFEFRRYSYNKPVWMALSPLHDEFTGDVAEPVLLARRIGEKRMPVVDFEGLAGKWDEPRCHHTAGATWQGKCLDCGTVCAPNLDELAERREANRDTADVALDSWDAS